MHRRLTPAILLLMCGGLYGLARETLFIQRSLQTNLYHTAAPAAVIFVVLIANWRRRDSGGGASNASSNESSQAAALSIRHWMPYGCLGACLALLWFSPAFHAYPGTLRAMAKGHPPPGLALFEDDRTIEGIPEFMGDRVAGVQGGIAGIQSLRSQGHSVVVLDDSSTLFNLATDNPPLFRDAAIFFDTFTTAQQVGIRETLYREKPDFALIRREEPSGFFSDTWRYLREALAERYVPYGDAGFFEVWKRSD